MQRDGPNAGKQCLNVHGIGAHGGPPGCRALEDKPPYSLEKNAMPEFEDKICTREQLAARVAALPKPVVLTNGVFDILHRGHVTYLAQARALGASLVVAANTDASVKRLGKGDDRPLNNGPDRMAVLAYGGQAVAIDFEHDRSTTKLVARIRG